MAKRAPQKSSHFLMVIYDHDFHLARGSRCVLGTHERIHEPSGSVHPAQPV